MAVTDGTAKFEKRKFADNEKLSMPSSQKIDIPLGSDFVENSNDILLLIDPYNVPSDGYISICNIAQGTNTGKTLLTVSNSPSGQYLSLFNEVAVNNYLWGRLRILPVRKGETIYVACRNIRSGASPMHLFFSPALSAT